MVAVPDLAADITAEWLSSSMSLPKIESMASERIGEGVGIAAELYRLTLTYTPGAEPGPKTLIAKISSSNPDMRALITSYGMYEREVAF